MIKSKEELMEEVKAIIGERTDDEALSFVEDINDSVNPSDAEDWKTKYEENDAAWRERYKARFFNGPIEEDTIEDVTDDEDETVISTYEELFKED